MLPSIPTIPIKEPRETIELVDFKKAITLHGKISCDMAERFYKQSRQAEFNLSRQQCIQDEALDYIRMIVKTSWMQLNITESEAHEWNPVLLNHRDMAILVYKLFGNTAKTKTQVQIFNAIKEFNFGWHIDEALDHSWRESVHVECNVQRNGQEEARYCDGRSLIKTDCRRINY
jgi:hypothetical protein